MKIGMIGLGTMGANMVERLLEGGHEVVGFDRDPRAVARVTEKDRKSVVSLDDLIAGLRPVRVVWIMVPAGAPVQSTLEALLSRLEKGDVVIDGGNSHYVDSMRRAELAAQRGVHFVDVGTSGGIWGRQQGYSMMVGGDAGVVESLRPILETLAPGPERGWGRVGPVGAGHFVKMVHNGIEYGLMQAYAEGFAILRHKEAFALDVHQVAEIWRYGSVVRSWLLDLTASGLKENPALDGIAPYVADSGEGRWTVNEAIDLGVPAPVITLSLMKRFASRDDNSFSDRLLALMRHEFGGHAIKRAEP